MSIKLLVVEDSPHKRTKIEEHIRSLPLDVSIVTACSFTSACRILESYTFDLLILDLSLPTFDTTDGAAGGRFRPFGGREIARKTLKRAAKTKLLFITQYQAFTEGGRSYTFADIERQLRSDCEENFFGMLSFDSSMSSWKEELTRVLNRLEDEDTNRR